MYLGCSSPERGDTVKRKCAVGCIGCRVCAGVTPSGAIVMEKDDGLPRMNYGVREDFEAAYIRCPMHCFVKAAASQSVDFAAQEALRASNAAGRTTAASVT